MDIELINGDDSFIFENVGYMEGFEYSSVRPVVEDVSGPLSSIYITSKFGRRRLSWQSLIYDDVFANRRLLLQAARQQGTIKTIEFATCDGLSLQAEIEIENIIMPYKNGRNVVFIEAIAPDWRFYSQDLHENNSANQSQVINNAGNEDTDPIFRIYGPFTSVTINNLNTSESFTIEFDEYTEIGIGEYVEIDVKNRTVKLNDGTSIYSAFDGEFFRLVPGNNTLQFSPIGNDGNTLLRTIWRDAYNGI
jgi:hypothetical protein